MIKLLHFTPLSVAVFATRTCWNSHDKSDNMGLKDHDLLNTVANKHKHKSVLEHAVVTPLVDNWHPSILSAFNTCPYSAVSLTPEGFIVTTNLRAIQNLDILDSQKLKLVPDGYGYLLDSDIAPSIENVYQVQHTPPIGQMSVKLLDTSFNIDGPALPEHNLNYSFSFKNISRALLQELARHRTGSPSVKSSRYTLRELRDETPFIDHNESMITMRSRASKFVRLTGDYTVDTHIISALENVRALIALGIKNDVAKYSIPEAYLTDAVFTIQQRGLLNLLKLRTANGVFPEIRELAHMMHEQVQLTGNTSLNHVVEHKPKG